MPVNPNAWIEITAFRWVPEFAQGVVRDLRARWALEEAGLDYRVRLLDQQRPPEYLREQPFDQVPCFSDGEVKIFESGAIVQYIGEKSEALLPSDPQSKYRAIQWTYAALNSDSEVMKFLGGPLDREHSDAIARGAQESFAESGVGKIAIERASDGVFLGMCGLSYEEWYPHDLELGWRLDRRYWGQGYASEAASAWLTYAFTTKAQLRIISIADVPNVRSIAVMKRLGMTLDHTAKLVHDLPPYVDRPAEQLQGLLDGLDRPHHARAESSGGGKQHPPTGNVPFHIHSLR